MKKIFYLSTDLTQRFTGEASFIQLVNYQPFHVFFKKRNFIEDNDVE